MAKDENKNECVFMEKVFRRREKGIQREIGKYGLFRVHGNINKGDKSFYKIYTVCTYNNTFIRFMC